MVCRGDQVSFNTTVGFDLHKLKTTYSQFLVFSAALTIALDNLSMYSCPKELNARSLFRLSLVVEIVDT